MKKSHKPVPRLSDWRRESVTASFCGLTLWRMPASRRALGKQEDAGRRKFFQFRPTSGETHFAPVNRNEAGAESQGQGAYMQNLRDVLNQAEKRGAAIGHFNVSDLVALKAVFGAAQELNVPVIVGASEGERSFMGVGQIAALVKSLREEFDFPVFLNADHTHSLASARQVALARFDSIVFDLSALPLEQNVRQTRVAVSALKEIHPSMLVEGEIGDIGSGSEIHETMSAPAKGLTTPEEARQFVAETGVDILAPAVGNMHGMSRSMVRGEVKQHLDIERIAAIRKAAGVPLTLHGGSGTDDDDFRRAIAAGISEIHINTELRVAWRRSLQESLTTRPDEVVPYKILPPVVEAVQEVVKSRLALFSNSSTPVQR